MAFDMKRLVVLAILGCAVIGVRGLPPRPFEGPRRADAASPERRAVRILERRARVLNENLKRVRWLERAKAALREAPPGGGTAPAVWASEGVKPETARWLEEGVTRQMTGLEPRRGEPAAIAVLVVDANEGGHPGLSRRRGGRAPGEYHVLDEERACVILVPLIRPEATTFRGSPGGGTDLLGPCALYREHGLPGREVARWMRHGGTAYSWTLPPPGPGWSDTSEGTGFLGIPGLFDLSWRYWELAPVAYTCLRGAVEPCAEVFLHPREASPMSWIERLEPVDGGLYREGRSSWFVGPFAGLDRTLLRDLRDEFGEDRFHAFWTSDAPVEEAFLAAFGVPVGRWMGEWARERVGPVEASPWPGPVTGALSLLTLGVLVGLAVRTAARRTLA